MKTADQALQAFQQIRADCEANYTTLDLSEADTRCKIIDRILTEVLNWDEVSIKREDKVHSGYLDYLLSSQTPRLVLEAKRKDAYFEIPRELQNNRYVLSGVISKNKLLADAIEQVRQYCSDTGVEFAAISNGQQFVVFRAIALGGYHWREGQAIVFSSLEQIEKRFAEFWNLLEKSNVTIGTIADQFNPKTTYRAFRKRPLDGFMRADELIARNVLHPELDPIVRAIFEDITREDDPEMLRRCYCWSEETDSYRAALDREIRDRMPHFLKRDGAKQIEQKRGKAPALHRDFQAELHQTSPAAILFLGGIGVGKTTFINNFFSQLESQVKSELVWLYVNFEGYRTITASETAKHVRAATVDTIDKTHPDFAIHEFQTLQQIFHRELTRELSGPLSLISDPPTRETQLANRLRAMIDDAELFLPRLFSYLQETLGKRVVLVFDNADQMPFESQQIVYSYALKTAQESRLLVMVSLREESYYVSSKHDVFSAHHNRKFHISAPNVLMVLRKRLSYAFTILKNANHPLTISWGTFGKLQLTNVRSFLSVVYSSLLRTDSYRRSQSELIHSFLQSLSGGNVRKTLEMFNEFLLCGHTNAQKFFRAYVGPIPYTIAFHEFVRSIGLGDYRYYRADRSLLANVLEPSVAGASHFTSLRLLGLLRDHVGDMSPVGNGFVDLDYLSRSTEPAGITSTELKASLDYLLKKELLEADTRTSVSVAYANYLRLTKAGDFYLSNLVRSFVYLDIVMQDTTLYDDRTYEAIRRLLIENDIPQRLERADIFITYLVRQEEEDLAIIPKNTELAIRTSYMLPIRAAFDKSRPDILDGYRRSKRRRTRRP